jgi:hypothetical protein
VGGRNLQGCPPTQPWGDCIMPEKSKTNYELLDEIGVILTEILQVEGLLLPRTVNRIVYAKDLLNKLKSRMMDK